MKMHTFKGGIFPPERKELSEECAITEAFPSTKTVTIPVTMGGAPNTVLVKVGDTVKKGQMIAENTRFINAPVHASISGKVKKIENHLVTANVEAPCIVIEADGSDETAYMAPLDPFTCSKEDAIARVRNAGIVGMGGAAFPTHVKMTATTIEYVLLNAAECEPYLTVDYRTMKETPAKVIRGLAMEAHIVGAKGIVVLEENKIDVKAGLEEEIKKQGFEDKLSVLIVKTKYPQGAEKNITVAALGREIPSGKLPADVGCMISNVGTACAVCEAFDEGKPVVEKCLTISGEACAEPKNIKVPVGTLVGDLIPEVIKLNPGVCKIIAGGPMMGFAMMNANFPIAKNSGAVLFLKAEETYIVDESPCINCGKCVKACPMHLTPVMISRSLKAGDLEEANAYGLMDCYECGSCAFTCPSNVRLVQRFRMGKALLRTKMAEEKAKADAEKAKAEAAANASKEGGNK